MGGACIRGNALDYAAAVDAAGMGALHNANLKALMGAVASAAPNNAVTATPTIGDMVRTLGKSGGPIVPLPPTLHCETTWTSDGELAGAGLDRGEPWGWCAQGSAASARSSSPGVTVRSRHGLITLVSNRREATDPLVRNLCEEIQTGKRSSPPTSKRRRSSTSPSGLKTSSKRQ